MSKLRKRIFLCVLTLFVFFMLPKLAFAWTDIDEPIYVGQFYDHHAPAEGKIGSPYGIATDYLGRIYVVDKYSDKIVILSSEGQFIKSFGRYGNLEGEFNRPEGIFIKGSYVYIADVANNRIQIFDLNGNFVRSFGEYGSEPGQLKNPYGVYVDYTDLVYVSDGGNKRISVFNTNGEFIEIAVTLSNSVEDVVRDDDGNFYLTSGANIAKYNKDFIYVTSFGILFDDLHYKDDVLYGIRGVGLYLYNTDGVLIRTFGTSDVRNIDGITNAKSIWIDDDNKIYILSDYGVFKVYQIEITQLEGGEKSCDFTFLWQNTQYYPDKMEGIDAFYIDEEGNYFVGGCALPTTRLDNNCTSYESILLEKYDKNKNLIFRVGEKGSLDGEFTQIQDILVDKKGNILIVDPGNNRVVILDSDGQWVGYLGTFGTGVGQFKTPYTITKDASGSIYVLDYGNNRIQKFDENYNYVKSVARPSSRSYSIDILDEKLYLSDFLTQNTYIYDLELNLIYTHANGAGYYPVGSILKDSNIITFRWNDYGSYYAVFSTTDYSQISSWEDKNGFLKYHLNFDYYNVDVKISDGVLYVKERMQKNILIYKFDRIGPELEIEKLNDDKLYSNNKILLGSLSDELTAITSVEFKVGDGDWNSCTSDDGTFDETSELFVCDIADFISAEGIYQFSVRATDSRTNTTVESFEYIYDTTSPILSTGLAEFSSKKDIMVSIIGVDNLAGLSEMLACENSEFTGCDWETYSETKSFTLSTDDGVKTIYVKVKDRAGNISEVAEDEIELDTVNNKPVITQLGLIKNIPNKDTLYYYFNANKVRIYGTAEPNSAVEFERSDRTKFTTQTDADGNFFIFIGLPNGETKLEYSSTDLAGNMSGVKTITLNIDTNYGTSAEPTSEETVTLDEEEVTEEESNQTDQEETPVVKSLLVVDSLGNILTNTTIEISGEKYTTDEKGYIHTDTQFSEEMIASIEGRNYTIDLANIYLTLTEKETDNKKINYLYFLIPIFMVLALFGGIIIYKRK